MDLALMWELCKLIKCSLAKVSLKQCFFDPALALWEVQKKMEKKKKSLWRTYCTLRLEFCSGTHSDKSLNKAVAYWQSAFAYQSKFLDFCLTWDVCQKRLVCLTKINSDETLRGKEMQGLLLVNKLLCWTHLYLLNWNFLCHECHQIQVIFKNKLSSLATAKKK